MKSLLGSTSSASRGLKKIRMRISRLAPLFLGACPVLSLLERKTAPKYALAMSSSSTATSSSPMPVSDKKLRLGLCQISVGADKTTNIQKMRQMLGEAKGKGAAMISLPECWNSPYSTAAFPKYAENVPSVGETPSAEENPSTFALCDEAQKLNVWLVGGSIPEREIKQGVERLYNTCLVINPSGTIVGKHRKVHLFDIDVPGRITFKESDSLSAGEQVTVVQTPWGGLGKPIKITYAPIDRKPYHVRIYY